MQMGARGTEMIIACALHARKAARTPWVREASRVLALLLGLSFRPAWGDSAQPGVPAITVEHPGGQIVIHDLAPALRLGPRLAQAAQAAPTMRRP